MKRSATVRFWVRQIIVAVLTYFVAALAQGGGSIDDWKTFAYGISGGVASAVLGLLGPHEPFVGIKYDADVPVPPADPVPAPK